MGLICGCCCCCCLYCLSFLVITASTSSTTSTTAAATSETENGLARCLSRLSALQREYSTRRAAAEHRLRLRQASLEASLRASLQQIRDEGDADAAETTVAILHRQRTSK